MDLIIFLLIRLIDIYIWIVILSAVVSWLIVFDVMNTRNKWVAKFCYFLDRMTSPVVDRLRRYVPPIGGIDLTPLVIIFGGYLLQGLLYSLL